MPVSSCIQYRPHIARTLIRAGLFITALTACCVLGVRWFFLPLPLPPTGSTFTFPPGQPLSMLALRLHKTGVLPDPHFFLYMARCHACLHGMCTTAPWKAGEYQLLPGDTLHVLLKKLYHGSVLLHPVTLLPGWTYAQVHTALLHSPYLTHTLSISTVTDVLTHLSTQLDSLEGTFLPETYMVARGETDVSVLQRAYHAMQTQLQLLWSNRDPRLPYHTPFQALILASLIEKETACEKEKSRIAGVLIQRLNINMPLASDPTVIYARQKKSLLEKKTLTYKDLKIRSPYNTYRHKGLPPSPIALPSLSSLYAALHPDLTHQYLYFVAKPNGCHTFSHTFSSHKKKAQIYHQYKKKQTSTYDKK